MPNRRLFLLLSLVAVAATAASAALGGGRKVGAYSPIKNLNDQHLVEIAQFAVDQYNSQNGARLQFVKIVKAEQQVVAGTNYRLVIDAKDGGAERNYEAIVYERPWQKFRQLTSFKPL
uniref:Cystatin domain-containing protein n=1 Tax=Opuntia streptacantha TaxID=393608 RepID=A0A7C9DV95_OPUST